MIEEENPHIIEVEVPLQEAAAVAVEVAVAVLEAVQDRVQVQVHLHVLHQAQVDPVPEVLQKDPAAPERNKIS